MIANFRSALPWWFYHTYVPIDYRIISYYVVSEFLSDPLFPRSSDNTTSRVPFHLTILLILYYIGVVVFHRNGMDEFRNELFDSLILVDSMLFDFWFSFFFSSSSLSSFHFDRLSFNARSLGRDNEI